MITIRSSHKRCSVRKVFLEISQHLQENTCARVSLKACNFLKKETLAQVFSCKCYVISKDTFFTEHPRTTATVLCVILLLMVNFWVSNLKNTFILVTLQKQSPKRCSTLLKKRLWHRCFPVDFAKSLKASPNGGCFWLYFLKSIESYFFRIVYFTSSCLWCSKTKSLSESLKTSCTIITGRYFSLLVYQRYWLELINRARGTRALILEEIYFPFKRIPVILTFGVMFQKIVFMGYP